MLFWLCATQRLFLSISGTSVHDCMDVWLLEYQHFGLSRRDQKEVNNIKITKKQVGKKTKMVIIFALLRLHFLFILLKCQDTASGLSWRIYVCIYIYAMHPFYSVSIGAGFIQSYLQRFCQALLFFPSKMWFFPIRFWTIKIEHFLKRDW